jgi:hypothetical protein
MTIEIETGTETGIEIETGTGRETGMTVAGMEDVVVGMINIGGGS